MTEDEILAEFRAADALLEGHFILSSGLRSSRYLQCARVLMDPARGARLATALVQSLPADLRQSIEAVVSPAMGGVIAGHEMGRALGVDAMFLERPDGVFGLRRGFRLESGARVLMMEDVVTTGLSSREAIAAIREAGGEVVAAAALVDRSGGKADLGVPFFPLLRLEVPTFAPDALPPELEGDPAGQARKPRNMTNVLRLGVNIDHVATVRNARGSGYPDPVRAALLAAEAGADGITAHLREDRRHITDDDIACLSEQPTIPLNLEMAATDEMLAIALRHRPHAACIVPEKREERTTEGGLDAAGKHNQLQHLVDSLGQARIRVSLFIEPDPRQIDAALRLGAPVVELHTGRYAELSGEAQADELRRLADAAALAAKNGIEVHAGHGLTYTNVAPIAAIPQIRELNIGHFLIGEALFVGLGESVRAMRSIMDAAR